MNPELNDKWNEAVATGQPIPIGDLVICDACDEDFTNSKESGGFLFGSYAYCPKCARDSLRSIEAQNESKFIKVRCKPDESFADFVRRIRGPDAFIQIGPMKSRPQ